MLRPQSLLPALAATVASLAASMAGVLAVPLAADAMPVLGTGERSQLPVVQLHQRAARRAPESTALSVTLDAMTPSYVPRHGAVRISGSITNEDDQTWTAINVLAFISASPITSTQALRDASELPPDEPVGARITAPGTYDTLTSLKPGQTAQFSVRVPRAALGVSASGVYWFGVHALGSSPDGRDAVADGRARTFLPLVPRTRRSVATALVVPLRQRISYAADGSLEDLDSWSELLSPGGRLRSLVDFGASAGSRPLTWLLDPALTDAVRRLTLGNPPRSLAPPPAETETPSESPTPDSTTASPEPSPSSTEEPAEEDPDLTAAATAGSAWLDRLHEALGTNQILALPYGDIDVAAAADRDTSIYQRARERTGNVLAPWGLPTSPAVAAPDGYLNGRGLEVVEKGATVLVTDRMFPDGAPAVARTAGARLVTTSSDAATGGPGPDARLAPVALRQRIVSEAALHLLAPERQPLVVVLPERWTPTATTGFFEGLDTGWLRLTTVGDLSTRPGRAVPVDELDYPRAQERRELDGANFTSAAALIKAGETLQNVLSGNVTVSTVVSDQALTSTSYGSRAHPNAARASADRSRAWIEDQLRAIQISAPRAVTLSSASGRFAATLTNGLDQTVTVSVEAQTEQSLRVSVPETIEIGPNGRTTVLLSASARALGVHNVTLVVTDGDGTPLGSSDSVPIRSAQVSDVIWVILGTGVALLFGAIAVRLFRRVRAARKAAHTP
ncbi:MAG TPA: DUF6049 family protein [Nocardioides sp.]|nr:DUF6049 family protein [Nocardioides sp.]